MTALIHSLERRIVIDASPEIVFRYFTDSARWAAWWGAGSSIDARPGGRMVIRYPDGSEAAGDVVEVVSPKRVVFTYGYAGGAPVPAGSTRVTIELEPQGRGTALRLVHLFADAVARDHHVQGWRYQLSLFANRVANDLHADPGALVDRWFTACAEPDERARKAALEDIAAPDVRLRDRFSCVEGREDLSAHIAGALRFMPGIGLARTGDVRHCQGVVLACWSATSVDGQTRGQGISVFTLTPDGLIESVTGFWT
jgi:uncharacterized protein YndB with AHSA1/START domain